MNVLFIGTGSIGKRHIKNLVTVSEKMGIDVTIDALRHQAGELPEEIKPFIAKVYYNADELPNYDVAFIANPTNLHFEIIKKLSQKVECFFIEKPIFNKVDSTLQDAGLIGKRAYVAAPMRFSKTFMELKKIVPTLEIYSARVICASYLPEWRKGVDYRKIYSAQKEMGGDVCIDLIHEWDYLVDLFGFPLESYSFSGHYSNLEINSDDISVYIARYKNLLAEIHLDFVRRGYERTIELLTNEGDVKADFGKGTVTLANGEVIDCAENTNQWYLREMEYFLNYATGKEQNSINTPQKAYDILKLALGVK